MTRMKAPQITMLLCALMLAGCHLGSSTGYVPTPAEIKTIRVGQDEKDDISARFGRPAVIGETENVWYYIASRRRFPGVLPTREEKRRVLEIKFSPLGQVRSVRELSLEDGGDIDISRYVTETGGRELSFWEQLRGNIGNFSAEDFLGAARGNDNGF